MARRLNQPLLAFAAPAHAGALGKSFSFCNIGSDHVTATAIKKAEDSDEIIVRLHEVNGRPAAGVSLGFATPILSAREVDGQEREIGKTEVSGGKLQVDLTPFALRAFAVKLVPPPWQLAAPVSQPIALNYDLDAVSSHEHLNDGAFDNRGHSYAGESFPQKIVSEGVTFNMGSAADGAKNALVCKGQSIALPDHCNRVYLLAAAVDGDATGTFKIDDQPHALTVSDWASPIGSWDDRLWQGVVPGLTYNWTNRLAGLKPGFAKHDIVAWCCSHRHDVERGNEYYLYTYLFKYALDVPTGARQLTLPDNDHIRIFAATAASNANDDAAPAQPLYDTLKDRGNTAGPSISPMAGSFTDSTLVTLHPPLYWKDHSLHFTTDGSEPTAESPVYTRPILVSRKTTIKAKEIDEAGSSATASAELDVNDTTPPKVKEVSGIAIAPTLQVRFSEPVRKQQAEDVTNYRLTPELKITAAELSEDGTVVTLKLAGLPTANDYKIAITGIDDMSPNANMVSSAPIAIHLARPVYTLDSFVASGKGLEVKAKGLPTKATDAWTINLFMKSTGQMEDRTLIAGFGENTDDGGDGHARYLAKFSSGLHFWSRNADGETRSNLPADRWQMITATYDGTQLTIYRNGKRVGSDKLILSDDQPVVQIAPLDPWDHSRRFNGEIRNMSIWNAALSAEVLQTLAGQMPK
jgi:alpha-mannosidase